MTHFNYPIEPTTPQTEDEMMAALVASSILIKAKRGIPLTEVEQEIAKDMICTGFAKQIDGLTSTDIPAQEH